MQMFLDPIKHARKKKAGKQKGIAREKWMRKTFPFLYRGFKTSWIDVNHYQIQLPRLPETFHNYRIAHLTDIHFGTWMTQERLRGIIDLTNLQHPDLVVITGDFISYDSHGAVKPLTQELSRLTVPDGILAIFGNHDHWGGIEPLMEMFKCTGIQNLNNHVIRIKKGESYLAIAGVDDLWEELSLLNDITPSLDYYQCNILLAHEPDFCIQSAQTGLFDLQLSGHSHGGQIRLPIIGPVLRIPGALKYPEGLRKIDHMQVFTCRGLGTSTIPVRINCKPEVAILNLSAH